MNVVFGKSFFILELEYQKEKSTLAVNVKRANKQFKIKTQATVGLATLLGYFLKDKEGLL